jgi:hypothetical protein
LRRILVHVVRDRSHVVEELRVHRPLLVLRPDGISDERRTAFRHRLLQGKALVADDTVTQSLVRRAVFIRRGSGAGKPTLIDAAAIQAVGVEVVRVQLETLAGLEE